MRGCQCVITTESMVHDQKVNLRQFKALENDLLNAMYLALQSTRAVAQRGGGEGEKITPPVHNFRNGPAAIDENEGGGS